ncbi:MAG TPA: TIGR02757 family protein [Thermoanaerobaculia bacterium]|nr:TIGR02757 family protein [Thermoanaerobaculia bacterium]
MESIRARRERDLRETLESLYRRYERSTSPDPIALVRRYEAREDREVAGWIASAFAYGRVDQIIKDVRALLEALGPNPAKTVAARTFTAGDLAFFRHRFHGPRDAADLLFIVGECIRREGSVGKFFARRFPPDESVAGMLDRVSSEALSWRAPSKTLGFLLPKPSDGSACKRWNLYLRWMVRDDAMDFGLWKEIPASALVIPTDTHVHRVSRRLGLTRRKSADWRTAEEITARLARLDPADPVKYDFAICQLGVLEICRTKPRLSDCPSCPAQRVCPIGRRRVRFVEAA